MRQYLGSPVLSEQVGRFWRLNRPVGAICHGVLVLARTHDPATGRSVLAGRRTTCLPKYMERSAYLATAWRLGRYYRTYPAYVEDEVRAALDDPARAPCPRAAPRPTTPRRSSSRTATTSPPAGRATRTCSAAGSPTCSSVLLNRSFRPNGPWFPRPAPSRSAVRSCARQPLRTGSRWPRSAAAGLARRSGCSRWRPW